MLSLKMNDLDKGILTVVDHRYGKLMPSKHIDRKEKRAIVSMIDGISTFKDTEYMPSEKQTLFEIARVAQMPEPKFRNENEMARERSNQKLKEKYQIYSGLKKAGNNSPVVKAELNKIYNDMYDKDLIGKHQYLSNIIL